MQLKVLGLQGATSINLVTAATAKMKAEETAAAIATTGLNAEKQIQILMNKGLTEVEAENAIAAAAYSVTTGAATTATGLFTGATLSLKAAFDGLRVSLMKNPITAILVIIPTIISIIKKIVELHKSASEKLEDFKNECSKIEDELETLDGELKNVQDRISELQSKDKLTFTEKEELENLQAQNAEIQRSIDLLKIREKEENKKKNNAFVEAMSDDVGSTDEVQTLMDKRIEIYNKHISELKELEDKYLNEEISSEEYESSKKLTEHAIEDAKTNLLAVSKEIYQAILPLFIKKE